MKKYQLLAIVLAIASGCTRTGKVYEETWQSLSGHAPAPEWYADAKFGIYFHWGVYSVPEFGNEWYPRLMHIPGNFIQKHHLEVYGDPNDFAYHDFVPMFTGEHFDAAEWVALFKDAGARFVGPVAEHHDGFAMWDSEITPWNSMDKGPHRDILGEIADQARKNDLKLITTFHHARNLQRYNDPVKYEKEMAIPDPNRRFDKSHYPFYENTPPRTEDPELRYLYGNIPEAEWNEEVWFGKLKEVIDKYSPDIIWFDAWLDEIPEEYRQKFCAYYLNHAEREGKEVVIIRKQDDLPIEFSVENLEKSRKNEMNPVVWETDETISFGSWSYTKGLRIKPVEYLVHELIDIVSKNGVLLLNVSPRYDGTIPDNQREVLHGIGDWLRQNGEGIYGTRPWYTFGEGPTVQPSGEFRNAGAFERLRYTNRDIRYTTKKNTVYAFVLGTVPEGEEILMTAFARGNVPEGMRVSKVVSLGSGKRVDWSLEEEGLKIKAPAPANEVAEAFKVVLK